MTLYVNDILRSLDPVAVGFAGLYRVLFLDGDHVHLMGLERPWRMPHIYSLKRISDLIQSGKLDTVGFEGHPYSLRSDAEIPETAVAAGNEAWSWIEPIVKAEVMWELFDLDLRGRVIGKRAQELGKHPKTLHRVLFRYWVYGQTEAAVRPNWAVRGGKGKRRTGKGLNDPTTKRIGRPSSPATVSVGGVVREFNTGEDDLAIFQNAMSLYFDDCRGSLKGVYNKMVANLYIVGYRERDGVVAPIPKTAAETPSFRMFEHAINRDWNLHELEKRRIGERKFLQSKRGLNGSGRENTKGPGDRYQIDATLYDIYLVNQLHRSWIIGRPVVYFVMDTFSTMIVGMFVGLWGPSWDCARLALMNAFTDKVDFCRKFAITISYEDWPCTLLPGKLFADRQELLTNAAAGLRKNLDINCEIASGYRPDLKFVESRFRIINLKSQVHWLPGAVSKWEKERNGRDYRLDAVLDLQQFTRILIRSVLHYNKFHFCPQHIMSNPVLARTTIDPTPISLWKWATSMGMGSLRREENIDLLRFSLLPTERASINERGILFRGMHYETDRAIKEEWFSVVRGERKPKVEVAYDLTWSDEIWVRDPSTRRFETARLRSLDSVYLNRRLEETLDFQAMKGVIPAVLVDNERESRASLDALIESEVDFGKDLAKGHSGLSNRAKVSGIQKNRAQARDEEKSRIANEAYGPAAVSRDATKKTCVGEEHEDEDEKHASNIVDLMRRRRPFER